MSKMSTVPVFYCRICGKPTFVTHLQTTSEDESGEKLYQLMSGLHKVASYCEYHRKQRLYYIQDGREREWQGMSGEGTHFR